MLGKNNWPLASALAMVLAAGVALVIAFTRSFMKPEASYHV
jgi:ABC-type spermidine/putrescine transport system permease subunit I